MTETLQLVSMEPKRIHRCKKAQTQASKARLLDRPMQASVWR